MILKKTNLPADYADFTDYPKSMWQLLRAWRLSAGDFFVLLLICVNLRNLRATRVFSLEGSL